MVCADKAADPRRYRVAYVTSPMHSGSTLLDLMLGAHPLAASVGEVAYIRRYAHIAMKAELHGELENRCTCGADNIWKCSFWLGVDESLQKRKGITLADLDIQSKSAEVFREHNRALFDAVAAITGASLIVDSSKSIARLKQLLKEAPFPVIPIRLTRDPRGQVYSVLKRNKGTLLTSAYRYNRYAWRIRSVLRGKPSLTIRYEDYVADPTNTMQRILERFQLNFNPIQLDWASCERHNISGNQMRITSSSQIQLDESWKTGLTKMQQRLVQVLTLPARILLV